MNQPGPQASLPFEASRPVAGSGDHRIQPTPAWQGHQPVRQLWQNLPPSRHHALNIILIIVAALVTFVVALYLTLALGPTAFVTCGLLALIPLGICLLGLRWVDRWEPEPKGAKWFAFLWGAGVSIALTLVLGPGINALLVTALSTSPDVVGPVIQAPLVEEFAKGLAVLILVYSRRSQFDGPVDGIVYAGLVGAGFAFSENILYFGSAVMEGGVGPGLAWIFVMRGLLSPFAHVMFTAATGLVLGWVIMHKGHSWALPGFIAGLVPAIAGHILWNGGLLLVFDNFFGFYILLQMPLFAAAVSGVFLLRRAERRLTHRRLLDYAYSGWLTETEVGLLATPDGRRQAVAWASRYGARKTMKSFVHTATRLAFIRQRIVLSHHLAENTACERQLLEEMTVTRSVLFQQAGAAAR
ncbi:PrsW family intramembrane metalloprotease [Arthrobacter roseus]|uniref:PrsW family intramembrane metalloprotease n=1 Tax=Arthrobacter roseus TaxID=136274 RepID=UPI0019646349|nr:PrsW family intramembrane metalloprotease [Arthrobacter roseus]MBM7848640.1 RsiW-degrading membrane proteinase PrsW (M82 family) [Arthrobacter roseus]